MRKISFILIVFFVLFFNSNLVKHAWGIAPLLCDKILKTSNNEIIKELYLGQCLFLNNASEKVYNWNEFSHVAIFIDEALWYRIVTNDDNKKRRAFMEYFTNVVKKAIELTGDFPPNTEPRFILVNKNGNVMARGIFINGEMIPNFVDPKFWNSR